VIDENKPDSLRGDDLRSLGKSNTTIKQITGLNSFDELFKCLYDRVMVMRAADFIEKITISHPEFLTERKVELIKMIQCSPAKN